MTKKAKRLVRKAVKKAKKKILRREYAKADVKKLRAHSKARTPLAKIMKLMKRTEGPSR
jgi:predicted ABC-type exoprotein transport system permease subunit